jgi:DNA-binding NarL/FixJ family response regulator
MNKITVLISDDHDIVRKALRCLLETASDVEVVGEAADGYQCVRETKRLRPNIVLLDVAMPLLNGMEAARQISREVPSSKVLMLSTYSDSKHVQKVVEAGAAGYLLKETAAKDLLSAIHEIQNGNSFFSPAVSKHLVARAPADAQALTARQAAVLQLIAEGYPTKQIADILSLSVKTAEKHRDSLMQKLNLHNIPTLTRYALSRGIVEFNPWPRRPEFIGPGRMTAGRKPNAALHAKAQIKPAAKVKRTLAACK